MSITSVTYTLFWWYIIHESYHQYLYLSLVIVKLLITVADYVLFPSSVPCTQSSHKFWKNFPTRFSLGKYNFQSRFPAQQQFSDVLRAFHRQKKAQFQIIRFSWHQIINTHIKFCRKSPYCQPRLWDGIANQAPALRCKSISRELTMAIERNFPI